MTRLFSSIVLTALFALACLPALAGGDDWVTDFEAAQKQAKEKGQYMLLDFTGSDWCGWCIKLNKEVFSKKEFQDYAKENLTLVELDFPRKKEQSDDLKKQNRKLMQKYGVRGFPTIIILDPEGELVARTGYRPGGADKYVEHLKELIDKHRT